MLYALPAALERLRLLDEQGQGVRILAAVDPAYPYGALLPWPEASQRETRPRRQAGAWVVLVEGRLALYLQAGGHALPTFPNQLAEPQNQLAAALLALTRLPAGARRHGRLTKVDGVPVRDSPHYALLTRLGYRKEYGGMRPARE